MYQYLNHNQPLIQTVAEEFFRALPAHYSRFEFDRALLDRLYLYAFSGKMFRATLMLELYHSLELSETLAEKDLLLVASALELACAALLIDDDIFDQAELRRGQPALHIALGALAAQNNLHKPESAGQTMAICIADVAFFIAYQMVMATSLPAEVKLQIFEIFNEELSLLLLAQVEDLRLSTVSQPVTKNEIIQMYIGKTGRYTGRWPLTLAAVLGQVEQTTVAQLKELGDQIGLLYQIKDDELGLYGVPEKTGKPNDSDVKENKQTLYRHFIFERANPAQRERLFQLYGNAALTTNEMAELKQLLQDHQIPDLVQLEVTKLRSEIELMISNLSLPEKSRALLQTTKEFVAERER